MSQKQANGRKREGRGVGASMTHSGNDGNVWEVFKKMWMECRSDMWIPIKLSYGWTGENDEFRFQNCVCWKVSH